MKRDPSFKDYIVHDVLGFLPGITSRAMFGGWGIYQNGLIVGILTQGAWYIKVDVNGRAQLEALGSKPFSYDAKDEKHVTLAYWLVPEELFMKKEELAMLIRSAAALSAAKKPRSSRAK